jgi:hypothetical protein
MCLHHASLPKQTEMIGDEILRQLEQGTQLAGLTITMP